MITKEGIGMFVIEIDENEKLKDEAYRSYGKHITQCSNGIESAGKEILEYEKMKEIIYRKPQENGTFQIYWMGFCKG